MKKIICAVLACILLFCVVACDSSEKVETTTVTTRQDVTLTKANIGKYLVFDGSFVDGRTISVLGGYFVGTNTLEVKAYPIVSGKFQNVEITLLVTSDHYNFIGQYGYKWHLEDSEDTQKIEITFHVSADGNFSKDYSVECPMIHYLDGDAKFEVVSVSGVFIPD